jgi:hypothetical protein
MGYSSQIRMSDESGQTYLVFPGDHRLIPPTTQIRSTLLMSSLRTLREAGLFEDYLERLAPELRDTILQNAAPRWLPIEVALGHYGACDALGLTPGRVVEMAQKVGMQGDGTFLGVALGLVRGLGVTPWTVLSQARRIWGRAWCGGAIGGVQTAAQGARIEVVGWPCARIPYCRHALRGLVLGVAKLLSNQVYVRELPGLQTDHSLALRIAWV